MTKTRKFLIAYTVFAVTALVLMIIGLITSENPRPLSIISPTICLLPAYIILLQRLKNEKEEDKKEQKA